MISGYIVETLLNIQGAYEILITKGVPRGDTYLEFVL